LRALRSAGCRLVVVTNQSAIGRGYFDEARLSAIHDRLRGLLAEHDVLLDAIYHCPHRPTRAVAAASRDRCSSSAPAPTSASIRPECSSSATSRVISTWVEAWGDDDPRAHRLRRQPTKLPATRTLISSSTIFLGPHG
jgi:hypothetical protein